MTPNQHDHHTDRAEAVLGLLRSHRSIRKFTDEPVPRADLIAAVETGQTASTSSAVQAYAVIRVTNPDARAEIADLAGPQEKVRTAPEFLVICGDTRRHRLSVENTGETYNATLEAFLLAVIDAALFSEKMVVALEAMGYGICYIGGIRNDLSRLDRTLQLPDGVYPLFGLCIGRPDQNPSIRPRLGLDAVLFEDHYPDDAAIRSSLAAYDDTYRKYLAERGATPKGWTEAMGRKFASQERIDLAQFYTSKGANLS